jgi:hypothetical protein
MKGLLYFYTIVTEKFVILLGEIPQICSYNNIESFGVSLIYPGHDIVPSASYLSSSYKDLFVEWISWYSQQSVVRRWSKWFLIAFSSLYLDSQLSLAFILLYKANRISSATRTGESNGHNNYFLITQCRLGGVSETILAYVAWSAELYLLKCNILLCTKFHILWKWFWGNCA